MKEVLKKSVVGAGKVAHEGYKFLKLLMILAIFGLTAFIAYLAYSGVGNVWSTLTAPFHVFGGAGVPENLPKKVSDDRITCMADTMLADFEGSPSRLEKDKRRILQTVAAYARTEDVDECEIFSRQMELVVPGSGSRKGGLVPNRRASYISATFDEAARNTAFLLAKEVLENSDPKWTAIVLVRPSRSWTFGNQSPAELDAIEKAMEPIALDGPSDFKFYKMKEKSK